MNILVAYDVIVIQLYIYLLLLLYIHWHNVVIHSELPFPIIVYILRSTKGQNGTIV